MNRYMSVNLSTTTIYHMWCHYVFFLGGGGGGGALWFGGILPVFHVKYAHNWGLHSILYTFIALIISAKADSNAQCTTPGPIQYVIIIQYSFNVKMK